MGLGGGKGNASPTEAPNTLRSIAFAKLLFLLCKGPIKGYVGDALGKALQIDGVPLVSPGGSVNFTGWNTYWREGYPVQDYVPGLAKNTQPVRVGQVVKFGLPITRTIYDADTDAVKVLIKIPALRRYKDNGDIVGTKLRYQILVASNGQGYETRVDQTLEDKTNSPYQRSHEIELNGSAPWDLRVVRAQPDSDSEKTQDEFIFESYTEVEYDKRRYNGYALAGLHIDSKQLSSVGRVDILGDWQIVLTPHNYNPITRLYSGAFNGTLIPQWTNNPVWVLYDVLTERVRPDSILLYEFYSAAQYCDELVDNGNGGTEPRFTFNHVFTRRGQAYEVAQSIAGTFNAKLIPRGAKIGLFVDRPRNIETAKNFGLSDMVGSPTYSRASHVGLNTVATVTYQEPNQNYEAVSFTVRDEPSVAKYGEVPTQITALGCTSRGQAFRTALWTLASPRFSPISVVFDVASVGLLVSPGDVISITDSDMQGVRTNGRIKGVTRDVSHDSIELDYPYRFQQGPSYGLKVVGADGFLKEYSINIDETVTGAYTKAVVLNGMFDESDVPEIGSPWMIVEKGLSGDNKAAPTYFSVIKVAEVDRNNADNLYRIEAVLYDDRKYLYIDSSAKENNSFYERRSQISLTALPGTPASLTAAESLTTDINGNIISSLFLSWSYPDEDSPQLDYFECEYKLVDELSWTKAGISRTRSITIPNLAEGVFEFRVAGISRLGQRGEWGYSISSTGTGTNIQGLRLPPTPIQNLTLSKIENRTVHLKWNPVLDLDVRKGGFHRVKHTPRLVDANWLQGTIVSRVHGYQNEVTLPYQSGTYMVRTYDSSGVPSETITLISTEYSLQDPGNVIFSFDESPNYEGDRDQTIVVGGALRLGNQETWNSIPAPFNAFATPINDWGIGSGSAFVSQGYYYFDSELHMGDVFRVNLYPVLDVTAIAQSQIWNNIPAPFINAPASAFNDSLELPVTTDFEESPYAKIQISLSQDNGVTYADWIDLIPGEYLCSDIKARVELGTEQPALSIEVRELQLIADVPDREERGRLTSSITESSQIVFSKGFYEVPITQFNILNSVNGDRVVTIDESEYSVEFEVLDNSGAKVSRNISWVSKGFGVRN